jgi:hypothetical protein
VLTTPSIVGQLVAGLSHRAFRVADRNIRRALHAVRGMSVAELPRVIYRRRAKMAFNKNDKSTEPRDCCVFKYVDAIWQRLSPAERAPWFAAVKKRGISGYDLWMSEQLYLALHAQYLANGPSISGGFSPRKAVPGTIWPPPPCLTWFPIRWAALANKIEVPNSNLIQYDLNVLWNPPFPAGYVPQTVKPASVYYGAWKHVDPVYYPQTTIQFRIFEPDMPVRIVFTFEPWTPPYPTMHLTETQHWTITRPYYLTFITPPDPDWFNVP